jgi:hypothetical protein
MLGNALTIDGFPIAIAHFDTRAADVAAVPAKPQP